MTTTTKESVKSDWTQAKQDNQQRAERIRKILKMAASETFSELKTGSAELNDLTRKSVAEWLEEIKTTSAEVETEKVTADADTPQSAETSEPTIPNWRELLMQSLEIVRDRKGDWLQQLLDHWTQQTTKFDADMTHEHGDRYLKAKTVFQRLISWLASAKETAAQSSQKQTATPVTVEVIDETDTGLDTDKNLDQLGADS